MWDPEEDEYGDCYVPQKVHRVPAPASTSNLLPTLPLSVPEVCTSQLLRSPVATLNADLQPNINPTYAVGRGQGRVCDVNENRQQHSRWIPRGPFQMNEEEDEEIVLMMRNRGLDEFVDTNLSSKTTRRMPATDRVAPGLNPVILDSNCFKLISTKRRKQPKEATEPPEDANSSISSDSSTSSFRYCHLESDSSSSSVNNFCRYKSPIVGVSHHEKVLNPREVYMARRHK